MNLGGMSVVLGLLVVAFTTMPYGILVILAMAWVISRG